MDGLLVLGITGVLLVAIAPMLLPWPQHARWLVAVQALDPARHLHPSWELREVAIVTLERCGNDVEIGVVESGADGRSATTLVGTSLPPAAITTLNSWFAAKSPLVMVLGAHQWVQLHCSTAHVTGLARHDHQRALPIESVRSRRWP